MRRRTYLTSGGASIVAAIAGCLDDTDDSDGSDNGTEGANADINADNGSDGEPEPEITNESFPEPSAVNIDNEHRSGDTYEFFAEIQNNGDDGDIEYTLVWMEGQHQDPWDPDSVVEASHERYFDAGERREVSVTAEGRDGYDGYGFRLVPGEVTIEVENTGADGRVEVLMMEGSEIVDETELLIDGNSTEAVSFETSHEFDWDRLEFDAVATTE